MKLRKRIITITSIFLAIVLGVVLTSCTREDVDAMSTVIGEKLPSSINTKTKLNSTMSAQKMFEIGVENFNNIDFAASYQTGTVETKAVGLETTQSILSKRVKDGENVYLDSYTFSTEGLVEIKAMYEIASDANGYRRREADKIKIENGELNAKKWKDTNYYDTYSDLMKAMPNDPKRVSMVNVNSDTVKEMTKPEYDRKTGQYNFEITLIPDKATTDYVDLMKFMVANNGVKNATISFTEITLEVVMWDNGLIRSITSRESYDLTGKMVINIKGSSNSVMRTYFSYDEKEMSYGSVCKF